GDFSRAVRAAESGSTSRTVRPWRLSLQVLPTSIRWQKRHSSPEANSGNGLPTWSVPQAPGSSGRGPSASATSRPAARTRPIARRSPRTVLTVARSGIGAYPAVGRVVALAAAVEVHLLQRTERVLRQGVAPGVDIDP